MFNPVATYRLQFHQNFTFNDLLQIIAYLQMLDIGSVYASPVFDATPGSMHGYDGTNPHQLNAEIGSEKQLKEISGKLKQQEIGWVQDIVPNHMAFHSKNFWLTDVLEKGNRSRYFSFFDIESESASFDGRLMVPFIDGDISDVIHNGDLQIKYDGQRLVFCYHDSTYPLSPASYSTILKADVVNENQAIKSLIEQIWSLLRVDDNITFHEEWHEWLLQFAALLKSDTTKDYINGCLEIVNQNVDLLQQIADEQNYKLCDWRITDYQINFRRFFTVNSLICLNIQHQDVFQYYHQFIKEMTDQSVFDGLRVDHIDGLYDPASYLDQLRELVGEEVYVCVEKILEPEEKLPLEWPIEGNTGYDFLALVNNLLTNQKSRVIFDRFYESQTGSNASVHDEIYEKKAAILYQQMAGEYENLFTLFRRLNLLEEESLYELNKGNLKEAIGEFLIQCPVYRFYGSSFPLGHEEEQQVRKIFSRIKRHKEYLIEAVQLLEKCLLVAPKDSNDDYNRRALHFYRRLMQFSGPLMAKGVEDTLMYTFNRFIGHNEVGDSPEAFGITTLQFHKKMKERQQHWPLSLNATATHDTKRGEDVRARLNVLTDLGEEWIECLHEWQKMNMDLKKDNCPTTNDELFIYQTLIGAFPMSDYESNDFAGRIESYLEKALREAKVHSSWNAPDLRYEEVAKSFAIGLLDERRPFWSKFHAFADKINTYGIINSLTQVLLKFTCPGVPDVYQGCELWDFSFVDPDNRRPVDYALREQWLKELNERKDRQNLLHELWQKRIDGKIKLWLTRHLFHVRKKFTDTFSYGHYIPLQVKGAYRENCIAFARRYKSQWIVVGATLHVAEMRSDFEKIDWKDTRIVLPVEAPEEWNDLLTEAQPKSVRELLLSENMAALPLILMESTEKEKGRGAGVLLSVTSLPAAFSIGDLGPPAYAFADFLSRSNQKYWQLLPLNPTEKAQHYSPYSSISSLAGNPLLISPEMLVKEGLLDEGVCREYKSASTGKVDYQEAERIKTELFKAAWKNFCDGKFNRMKKEFRKFCDLEKYWLDDFALYVVLKQNNQNAAWHLWPPQLKFKDTQTIDELRIAFSEQLEREKWLQFIFSWQWSQLKHYCNGMNIEMLGDLPFYVSYDSVDVWANKDIFSLDEYGNMMMVAGVPPDYFNSEGQLWGMPVFRWDVLRNKRYAWWIRRVQKNLELYDVLRLDHFRAFSAYWQVQATEETAVKGEWKPGPGASFFNALVEELGDLPFLAEDLGDIDTDVYRLRDQFEMPGMKVLQFAFGDDSSSSLNSPHNYTTNYFVYTGTHDNNTSLGWFRNDARELNVANIEDYTGIKVNESNIASVLSRMAYASVAKVVILPMQDVLGLDERSRMNIPASTENNWLWRLEEGEIHLKCETVLRKWVKVFNR